MTWPSTGVPCSVSFQAEQLGHRVDGVGRLRDAGERADVRDAGRDAVVALRLRADDGLVDPALAPLEDLAVAIDEEVVADVPPALRVAVIAADRADDRGGVLRPVVVRVDGVVHERGLDGAVRRAEARRPAGLGTPFGAGDDLRRAGRRVLRARGRPRERDVRVVRAAAQRGERALGERRAAGRVDELRAQAARDPREAQLEGVGASGPHRLGARAAGVVAGHRGPRAPRPVRRVAHADPRADVLSRAPPAQADEVKALVRVEDRAAPAACARVRGDRLAEVDRGRDVRAIRQRGA